MPEHRPRLAVVIPVYGNEGSLEALHERIDAATRGLALDLTVQYVNDRSPDGSQAVLERLAQRDPRVRVALLSKNHGSFIAILAGLTEVADHDAAVIMAADLQDPPEKIPEMVARWRDGYPVVLCTRRKRADPWTTVLFSRLYNRLFRALALKDMPAGGFDVCLLSRQVMGVVLSAADRNTNLAGLILWSGFERATVEYDREERVHGKSMWSLRKKVEHAINGIISFSNTPLRFFAWLGVLLSFLAVVGTGVVLRNYLAGRITIFGWTSVVVLMLMIAAFQFLSIGVLGEYLWYFLEKSSRRPTFIVERRVRRASARQASREDAVPFFSLDQAFPDIRGSTAAAVERIQSSRQLILGGEVARFEKEFAAAVGARHAVGVANGTDALTLSLWACGVRPGDVVLTSALSAPATAVAILRAGARPQFADVLPDTLTIDPDSVARALSAGSRIKAVVPVHLYGNPCDMEALLALAAEHGASVVEDCAQAFGSTHQGRACGAFGRVAAFSFYPTKNLGGYGDGGAVVTDDAELADALKRMRFYGQDAAGECVGPGMNSRLDELQAAILTDRLSRTGEHNRRREEIARAYDAELADLRPVPSRPGRAPHLYVVRAAEREALRAFLTARGVQTSVHYPLALSRHRHFVEQGVPSACPVAEAACSEVLSLPIYPSLAPQQLARVVEACAAWRDSRLSARA